MVKVWAVGRGQGQGWDLGRDLVKALVAALVGWAPGVGWALAVVKGWGLGVVKACRQAPLPGCV